MPITKEFLGDYEKITEALRGCIDKDNFVKNFDELFTVANFKAGDLVVGTPESDIECVYTTSKALMEVTEVDYEKELVRVKILSHLHYSRLIEVNYDHLSMSWLKLASGEDLVKFNNCEPVEQSELWEGDEGVDCDA